jgi:hypothetical protein
MAQFRWKFLILYTIIMSNFICCLRYTLIMRYFIQSVNIVRLLSLYQSACPTSETDFNYIWHWRSLPKVFRRISVWSSRSNITPALHEVQIELIGFLKKLSSYISVKFVHNIKHSPHYNLTLQSRVNLCKLIGLIVQLVK